MTDNLWFLRPGTRIPIDDGMSTVVKVVPVEANGFPAMTTKVEYEVWTMPLHADDLPTPKHIRVVVEL